MSATLCDEQDLKDRLGRDLTTVEAGRWEGAAKEASVLVESYVLRQWAQLSQVPDGVRVVTSRMTARALTAPSGPATPLDGQQSTSSSFGPMSYARNFGTDSVFSSPWMSKADRLALNPYILRRAVQNEPMYDPDRVAHGGRLGYDFAPQHRGWGWW